MGDVDEIAYCAVQLLARQDEGATHALALLDDSTRLAAMAESLLADVVIPTPYVESLLRRCGAAAARALWAARIRRPATEPRRMRFVTWLHGLGRHADDVVVGALEQLAVGEPTARRAACAEDVLLALPRTLDGRLARAVEPFRSSPSLRLRELASRVTARHA